MEWQALPPDELVPMEGITLTLDPAPHPFGEANGAAIAANWEREREAQPALFNGEVMLFSRVEHSGGRMRGLCHRTTFATLLYWRTLRPHPGAIHCFGHAALVSSDDALVAIRMGPKTANAGKVYFSAGSYDGADERNGRLDIGGNMRREVGEETGLDLAECRAEPGYHVLAATEGTVIFQRYRLPMTADEAHARIAAHVAADADPEITEAVILRDRDAAPEGLLPHMVAFRDWHFANPMSV